MREVIHRDVTAAAQTLLPIPPEARGWLLRRMIAEAEIADRCRKRVGQWH